MIFPRIVFSGRWSTRVLYQHASALNKYFHVRFIGRRRNYLMIWKQNFLAVLSFVSLTFTALVFISKSTSFPFSARAQKRISLFGSEKIYECGLNSDFCYEYLRFAIDDCSIFVIKLCELILEKSLSCFRLIVDDENWGLISWNITMNF